MAALISKRTHSLRRHKRRNRSKESSRYLIRICRWPSKMWGKSDLPISRSHSKRWVPAWTQRNQIVTWWGRSKCRKFTIKWCRNICIIRCSILVLRWTKRRSGLSALTSFKRYKNSKGILLHTSHNFHCKTSSFLSTATSWRAVSRNYKSAKWVLDLNARDQALTTLAIQITFRWRSRISGCKGRHWRTTTRTSRTSASSAWAKYTRKRTYWR